MHTPSSHGLLILGMHRSGTSALARVLGLGGADLGREVSGASAGNDTGHWEDAHVLALHERTLAGLDAAWDEPLLLPPDWASRPAGRALRADALDYLRSDRSRHALWAMKEPRQCLFADAWREAAAEAGLPVSVVLVLRHPAEVAASLALRDGMAAARAHLLWLEYTLAALETASRLPHVLVDYASLLQDWPAVLRRIAGLPGAAGLADTARYAGAVAGFLDPARRHQRAPAAAELPPGLASAWRAIAQDLASGRVSPSSIDLLRALLGPLRALAAPVLAEARARRLAQHDRAAAAEATLAAQAPWLALDWGEIRARLDRHHAALVDAISGDLRVMQQAVAEAQAAATERQAAVLRLAGERDEGQARLAASQAQVERASRELATARGELSDARHALAALRHEAHDLRAAARQLAQLTASRSWRWTRPLRALGRLLRGDFQASDRARVGHALRAMLARLPLVGAGARARLARHAMPGAGCAPEQLPDASQLHLVALAPPSTGLPDVFIGAVIDWHFRFQRPQHLARALARRGHRVFYLSNNFADSAAPGFRIEPLGEHDRLFQVHLNLAGKPPIYFGMPASAQVEALRASLAELLAWAGTHDALALVQHPYWAPLARQLPAARVVYDCMDHHGGFENNAPAVLEAEAALVADADLVIVTSGWLEDELRGQARATRLVRNAGEFEFFRQAPGKVFRDPQGRRVIGYYGAIAEWFDAGLVRAVATAFPEAAIVLVGNDTAGVGAQLADLDNVRMVGEVPYAELPYWLYGFDVCLLPFQVLPLTLATNPVKVYEYLAAAKPVVAVDLPEMAQFAGLVATATDAAGFVAAVGDALAEADGDPRRAARRDFAAGQTWDHRATDLDQALAALPEPRVSVIVLTYNNLAYTEACLFSLEAYSQYRNLEVIVVDNASTDGSREWLQRWAEQPSAAGHQRRLLPNADNLGFAAGNNVGLAAATGEVLVMLNNDTYVTPGWVRGLCNHLWREPRLGLVGPVTNNIGNEARIGIQYADMPAMIREAGAYTRRHAGQRYPLRTAAFFCVAMRRATYEAVGPLDEAFGLGFFEDDDYCRRVERAGLDIACAEDVFVHHHLSASFDALKAERRQALFETNKAIYEAKWGEWVPHAYRSADARGGAR